MSFRATYSIELNSGYEMFFINTACFSRMLNVINHSKKILRVYVLKKYGGSLNNLKFSKEQIQLYINAINTLGFNVEMKEADSNELSFSKYFNDSSKWSKKHFDYADNIEDSKTMYVFKINLSDKKKVNQYTFMIIFSLLRYLYEGSHTRVLTSFFKINSQKQFQTLDFPKKMALAHASIKGISMGGSGHSIGPRLDHRQIADIDLVIKKIFNNPFDCHSCFEGKRRSIVLSRNFAETNKNNLGKLYKYIK